MSAVLVDSNVLLDVLTEDPAWLAWSSEALARAADKAELVLNPIVYAEVSVGFDRVEDLEAVLPADVFNSEPPPLGRGIPRRQVFPRPIAVVGARSARRCPTSTSAPMRRWPG